MYSHVSRIFKPVARVVRLGSKVNKPVVRLGRPISWLDILVSKVNKPVARMDRPVVRVKKLLLC